MATCSQFSKMAQRRSNLPDKTYVVLKNVPVAEALDAELVHPNPNALATVVVAWPNRVRGIVTAVIMLKVVSMVRIVPGATTYPIGLGGQVAALVDPLGQRQRVTLLRRRRLVRHVGRV